MLRRTIIVILPLVLLATSLQAADDADKWREHCFAVQNKLQQAFTKMNREQNYSVREPDGGWWDEAIRRKYIRQKYHDPGQGPLSIHNFTCDHNELLLCRVHGQCPANIAKHRCYQLQGRLSWQVRKLEDSGERIDRLTSRRIKDFNSKGLNEYLELSGGLAKHDFQIDKYGEVYCTKHGRSPYSERAHRCHLQQERLTKALEQYWKENPGFSRVLDNHTFSDLYKFGYLDKEKDALDDPGKGKGTSFHYCLSSDGKVMCRFHHRPRKRPKPQKRGWLLDRPQK